MRPSSCGPDLDAFATAVEGLLDDPAERARMGASARQRVSAELDWQPQAQAYVTVFDELLNNPPDAARLAAWPFAPRDADAYPATAGSLVDLDDAAEFERFIIERSSPIG